MGMERLCISSFFQSNCFITSVNKCFSTTQLTFTYSKKTIETLRKVLNMSKVNNKNNRTTFCCVSFIVFEQVNVNCEIVIVEVFRIFDFLLKVFFKWNKLFIKSSHMLKKSKMKIPYKNPV